LYHLEEFCLSFSFYVGEKRGEVFLIVIGSYIPLCSVIWFASGLVAFWVLWSAGIEGMPFTGRLSLPIHALHTVPSIANYFKLSMPSHLTNIHFIHCNIFPILHTYLSYRIKTYTRIDLATVLLRTAPSKAWLRFRLARVSVTAIERIAMARNVFCRPNAVIRRAIP
jgi:hypothetical protein